MQQCHLTMNECCNAPRATNKQRNPITQHNNDCMTEHTHVLRDDIRLRIIHFKREKLSFFWTSKLTFKRVLQNLVQMDYDYENYEYDDENGYNIDDYNNENDQKPDKCHGVIVKIYPF